jgi:hypothetical protein
VFRRTVFQFNGQAITVSRNIDDILRFRKDISPFLVHLTRDFDENADAASVLTTIISEKRLKCGSGEISSAAYGMITGPMPPDELKRWFAAICLTETPLEEIHCLLEIRNRRVNLQPYGLVFLKDKVIAKHDISPVLYFNNTKRKADVLIQALCTLIATNPSEAERILPLVSTFGLRVTPPRALQQTGRMDFYWEREWRLPSACGDLTFDANDVFVGLCPHDDIPTFEALFTDVQFIDPCRNTKWYATTLEAARQRRGVKNSIV